MARSKSILNCIATKSKQITSSGLSGAETMNIFNPSEITAEIGRRKVMNTFIYKRNNMHCNHIIKLENCQTVKIGVDGTFLPLNVMTLRIFFCNTEIRFIKDG